jgi:hypothetical protein
MKHGKIHNPHPCYALMKDVQGLADELQLQANQMAEPPSDYAVQRQFIQALKPEVSRWILRNGRNPENSQLAELVDAARNYEDSEEYKHTMQGHSTPRVTMAKKVAMQPTVHNRVNSNRLQGKPTF